MALKVIAWELLGKKSVYLVLVMVSQQFNTPKPGLEM